MDTPLATDVLALRRDLIGAHTRVHIIEAELANVKAHNSDLEARNALMELQIQKMRRALYGQSSERSIRLVDQLELGFEDTEATASEDEALAAMAASKTTIIAGFERKRPSRKHFPDHLPRERVVVEAPTHCPCCQSGRLSKLGENITETLEVIPRRWKVVQTVRERFSCRTCEAITQVPAPFHIIPRGWARPSFLAMMLFEKFGQHQPLNRQRDRYAREGVDLSLSTLADQVGACWWRSTTLYADRSACAGSSAFARR
jgi:transposase